MRPPAYAFLFLLTVFINLAQTAKDCDSPFSDFLQCMAKDADARIDKYKIETTPTVQTKIQQCFLQSQCTPPDFSQAQIGYFVQEPWTSRVNAMLDVLETMDPRVQRCMTDYFKGIMAKEVNECVKKHGPRDVKDFRLPHIPGGNNVDIPKMKRVFLQRMMVQYQLSRCTSATGDNARAAGVVRCIRAARQDTDSGMCGERETCVNKNIKDKICLDRYNKVQKAACECFTSEQGKKAVHDDIQHTILNGDLEKQFKLCHDQHNVPYPKAKVEAAKQAAKDALVDYLKQGSMPAGVQGALRVGNQVLSEVTDQWKDAFCTDCRTQPSPSTGNQFQPAVSGNIPPAQPAVFGNMPSGVPAVSAQSLGGGAKPFVIPPPLPPQAMQQSSSQQDFENFKNDLTRVFGPAPPPGQVG